jgi:hypothetical protein
MFIGRKERLGSNEVLIWSLKEGNTRMISERDGGNDYE